MELHNNRYREQRPYALAGDSAQKVGQSPGTVINSRVVTDHDRLAHTRAPAARWPNRSMKGSVMTKHDNTAHTFREQVAARLAQWAQVGAMTNAGLTHDLAYVGLSAEIKASDTPAVKLEIKHDPNEGLPAGTKREDFTAEALAKYDAKVLSDARQRTWQLIRARQQNGAVSADEATATLASLGFDTDTYGPKLESAVSVYAYDAEGMEICHFFKVAGKASVEGIRDRFTAALPPHPADEAVRAVMGDEAILPKRQASVSVRTSVNWPDPAKF